MHYSLANGYLAHLFLDAALAFGASRQPAEEHIDDEIVHALQDAEWPPYTILCPLYREAQVVPQFVKAMKALDYPLDKLQIMFLTEEDDGDTRAAIKAMRLPPHFKIVTVPDGSPRTKPRACNYGLIEATGTYVVIYDAEDVPDPLQLKKTVLTFANYGPDLACVQAKLNFYNPEQNLLTRWFTAEYSLWFDLILPGLQWAKLAIPLGGTSNHFPTQTLRALGGWDAFNVTEDCDLGLRLAWFRLKTVVLNSTTYEEANSRVKNWIRQRSRWIKGYMQTYLVHMREPSHYIRNMRLREFLSLQLVIGGKAAVLFINPLMWLLLAVSLIFRQSASQFYSVLFPPPVLFISAVCLVLGNFFYAYTYLLGCIRRKQYALVKWMLLIPIYWIMTSIAACMALYQLIVKPHYWEKTIHGLHLGQTAAVPQVDPEWEALAQLAEDLSPVSTPTLVHAEGIASHIQKYERLEAVPVASVQDTLAKMIEPRKSAFLPSERAALRHPKRTVPRDRWFMATLFTAYVSSLVSCWYFFQHHMILLYNNEASAHLGIARSISTLSFKFSPADVLKLPLPHLLMLPFVANDYLWHTGLAGSIPAMLCYVVTAVTVFLTIRRLTQNSPNAFMGALLFALNPTILYLQSTPLTASVSIATITLACYYFLAWAQTDRLKDLLLAAGSACLATLSSYSGWALFLILALLVVVIGKIKHQVRPQIESNMLVFSLLGGLGIGLWLLWCQLLFGNLFYFVHMIYTSQAQSLSLSHMSTLAEMAAPAAIFIAALLGRGFRRQANDAHFQSKVVYLTCAILVLVQMALAVSGSFILL